MGEALRVIVPVEERPECPERGQHDKPRGHGLGNPLDLLFGRKSLFGDDVCAIGSNDTFKGRNHEGKWQTEARLVDANTNDGVPLTPDTQ